MKVKNVSQLQSSESWVFPLAEQESRNRALLEQTPCLGEKIRSEVLPFALSLEDGRFPEEANVALSALEKDAATIAVESLVSLAEVNDLDHLGGGLELIGPLLLTLSVIDYDRRHFAIEHGHTSIGYYAALAALGFLPRRRVIDHFRRSLDIAGHVSWVPGGTQLCSGRLGVMMPASTGLALGLKARKGTGALVICHCGDAGWVSGQALNGLTAASLHEAPVMFVMHRNGIQLSGTTAQILDRDPRPVIASLGIEILELSSLHNREELFRAYGEANRLAQAGRPSLIYPTGWRSTPQHRVTVRMFGEHYGIENETRAFAESHAVSLDTEVWIPGSAMSYRDVDAMLECFFYVNDLPGGHNHHDGGMKGRDANKVLSNATLRLSSDEQEALNRLREAPPRVIITTARPARGTPNLGLEPKDVAGIQLPGTDKWITARAGSEVAYHALAKKYPDRCFFVSCDLNPSTKLGKAADVVPRTHTFEMGIQEQAGALVTNGLAVADHAPQLNVFATFTAFIEGIAREGFEFWRYQRNLNGLNEGLNVLMHLSHVGACTGRDHFSGWSLDWVNLSLGYLPFLRKFYAPADARSAFLAVKDAASAYGGHIVAIPRDNLPVLTAQGTDQPLWKADDDWEPVTTLRAHAGARNAILALGAPSFLAAQASDRATAQGEATDVYVINGFPLPEEFLDDIAARYPRVLTIEDGLIGTKEAGLRGFAAYVAHSFHQDGQLQCFGIADPRIAPSDHYMQVWEHYGMTADALTSALRRD
jgi:transketolase N-terminal domain/subunit/transketolase C-terminal domain/subunit